MTIHYLAIPGIRQDAKVSYRIDDISKVVAKRVGITYPQLFSTDRKSRVVIARHLAMYFIRKHTPESLMSVGRYFNRDHSSVIHAVRVIEDRIRLDENVRSIYNDIEKALHGDVNNSL